MQLGYCVWLVVVIVKSCGFLVHKLSLDKFFAAFSTIKQVHHLLFEELLKIGVVLRNL